MKQTSLITLGILVVVVFALGLGVYFAQVRDTERTLIESSAGAAFNPTSTASYTDLVGNSVSLQDKLGKHTVVFSWASWCPSCGEDLLRLSVLAEKFPDIDFVAINRAEPASTANRFLSQYQTSNVDIVLDGQDHFFSSQGGYAMPELIVYDEKGSVVAHERGEVREAVIEALLQDLKSE